MKRVKLLSIITLLCASMSATWAQTPTPMATFVIAGQSFGGISPLPPGSSDSNLTIGGLTRASGIASPGSGAASNAWGATGFNDGIDSSSQTKTSAITQNNFITFSFTAHTGYTQSFSNIGPIVTRRSATGPTQMIWQYSLDGTNYVDFDTMYTASTATAGVSQAAVDLTGISALQNVPAGTTVTFRAVMFKASGQTGTWYLFGTQNLIMNGFVNPSAPLPLNLISFKGTQSQNVNHLAWVTSQEKYITRFELERATDGIHFSKIAEVNSAVKSDNNANNNYSYDDNNAAATAFYRLKIVEVNGTFTYSEIVVLRKGAQQSSVKLYPNPTDGTLFIEGLKGASSYQVTDATGRVVIANLSFNSDATTVKAVDVSGLMEGIYFVQMKDENGSETIRFVKK